MEKREFLEKLRRALNGRLASEEVFDTVSYYEDYINIQVRMGREEAEVLESLGDPRLIARTIVETDKRRSSKANSRRILRRKGEKREYPPVSVWVWLALILIASVMMIVATFRVLRALWPFVVVVIVATFFAKMFQDRFR